MKFDKEDLLLYAVTDRTWLGQGHLSDQVEAAILGGVTFVQLREKELGYKEFLAEAKDLKELCNRYRVPFVINDNVDIALEVNADGVHVGQSDIAARDARSRIGTEKILGVSVQTLEQAIEAERNGADYLGVGAVFPTNSKADAVEVSFDTLSQICNAVRIPIVAIGGIGIHNIEGLKDTGIYGVAIISGLFAEKNIQKSAEALREKTESFSRFGAIFDLDGTILDSMSIWNEAGYLFLKKLGIEGSRNLGKRMFSMTMQEGAAYLQKRYELSLSETEIIDGIDETVADFYRNQVKLKPGMEELLHYLKQSGWKLTVATSSDRRNIEPALKRLGIDRYFDQIFTCSEVGVGKENPKIYLDAATAMNTCPRRTWIFEDALHGIQTGNAIGFQTVGVYDDFSKAQWEAIQAISTTSYDTVIEGESFVKMAKLAYK